MAECSDPFSLRKIACATAAHLTNVVAGGFSARGFSKMATWDDCGPEANRNARWLKWGGNGSAIRTLRELTP
jgi:hypothetical protein